MEIKRAPESHLTIKRKKQLMEANLPLNILINGHLAAQLRSGEEKEVKIFSEEPVLMEAVLYKNKSKTIRISLEERKENIYEISHAFSNWIYLLGVTLAIVSTILLLTTNQMTYMLLVAPPACLFLYYKFLRKEKYLSVAVLNKSKEGEPN